MLKMHEAGDDIDIVSLMERLKRMETFLSWWYALSDETECTDNGGLNTYIKKVKKASKKRSMRVS